MFEEKLVIISKQVFANKHDVIAYLTHLNNDHVHDCTQYLRDIMEREAVVSTSVGYGIAIPHARSCAVFEPFVVYARLENGVVWGTSDEIVRQVFLLGVPQSADQQGAMLHLKILSELSKRLMHVEFRESLLHATNTIEIYDVLNKIEEEMEL